MRSIDINTRAVVAYTRTLERMHRSALPVAIRSALNSAAYDVKKETMPREADSTFEKRKPTFFKANSKVVPAQGFDLRTMQATVGFVGKNAPDQAVEDLEQQEHGGTIGGRSFVPLVNARTGRSWKKNVRANARISDIKSRIVDANDARGKNPEQKFVKSAVHAGKGGWVLGNRTTPKGNRILFQVRSLKRIKGNMMVKSVPMFALKAKRKVQPKATHFMQKASEASGAKIAGFYMSAAQKQIDKVRTR